MKEKLELLIANIRDDLNIIGKMKAEYDIFIQGLGGKTPDNFQKAVIGYYLHNFYNACENIFLNIAKAFENNIDPQEWHKSILKRMKLEIDGIRPRIISDILYRYLDEFRAFRHIFRHIYSYELDWEKEKIVADRFNETVLLFNKELGEYIIFLKNLLQ
ncbi:MAG: antitoxin [Ruminiclostridium sp.]|nr:antitoxin [Ruminiclostridium sp.]